MQVVERIRQRREVARLDRHELGQRPVAVPVGQSAHPVAHGEPRVLVVDLGDHPGDLVAGDGRRTVLTRPVDPRPRPCEFVGHETGRLDLHDHIARDVNRLGRVLVDEQLGPAALVNAYSLHLELLSLSVSQRTADAPVSAAPVTHTPNQPVNV